MAFSFGLGRQAWWGRSKPPEALPLFRRIGLRFGGFRLGHERRQHLALDPQPRIPGIHQDEVVVAANITYGVQPVNRKQQLHRLFNIGPGVRQGLDVLLERLGQDLPGFRQTFGARDLALGLGACRGHDTDTLSFGNRCRASARPRPCLRLGYLVAI
jgi:hypothetical protein